MKNYISIFIFFFLNWTQSQNVSLNQNYIEHFLRFEQLKDSSFSDISFSKKPFKYDHFKESEVLKNHFTNIFTNKKNNLKLTLLPLEYNLEYNTHHPYNRNNGNMIPNVGYQHIISFGFYTKIGPLEIQLSPEHHYAVNEAFDGFWDGHFDITWKERYERWNFIDTPERFGSKRHNRLLFGQSFISLNFKKLALSISNENLWWGPSKRNSIMLSNHSSGFKHITFKSTSPIKTFFGNFDFQILSGRLEPSRFLPPDPDREYGGRKLYIPKINQNGRVDDWRYYQAGYISISPRWIDGLTLGMIRWVQMYRGLVEGDYWWMPGKPTYFPLFSNFFRKNDSNIPYEEQTDQAAGLFFRWYFKKSKMEIYSEFHRNDAIYNLRDFLVDGDHTRGLTLGISKILDSKKNNYLLSWEWTQLEATAGTMLRGGGSWYEHSRVFHGYTNFGEVIGAGIGPGSNSQFFSIEKFKKNEKLKLAFEIVENDNDWYYKAFSNSTDFRRYWKDFNFHLGYDKKFNQFWISSNLIYNRNLNYQWELISNSETYYQPGRDTDNFHFSLKLSYFLN